MSMIDRIKRLLSRRRRAYLETFDGPMGREVLQDLARFCRAHSTTVVPDSQRATDVLEGRREVWLRIQHHLQLSDEDLWEIYKEGR